MNPGRIFPDECLRFNTSEGINQGNCPKTGSPGMPGTAACGGPEVSLQQIGILPIFFFCCIAGIKHV
jgi:hypothetical protein